MSDTKKSVDELYNELHKLECKAEEEAIKAYKAAFAGVEAFAKEHDLEFSHRIEIDGSSDGWYTSGC